MDLSNFANPDNNRLLPCGKSSTDQSSPALRQEIQEILQDLVFHKRKCHFMQSIQDRLKSALEGTSHVSNDGMGNTV